MVNLLHLLNLRTRNVRPGRRRAVPIPTGVPTTDAVFLLLRRMRAPFVVLIITFTTAMIGMSLIPGRDSEGNPYHFTLFDALYQMTMTVTTVGYTEAPYPFTYAQRMWMTASIFALVLCWAYTIGVIFSIMQDSAFQQALATQRFRRRVKAMREHFALVVGYGAAGQAVGYELDRRRRRFVVVEKEQERVESVWTEELHADVPTYEGDAKVPASLGLAGLGHPLCDAVLALTDDDEANLAVVMSTALLRPDLPVIARCVDKTMQARMEEFSPTAVINPDDRYGGYLALQLRQPTTHQLVQWLMDNDEEHLPTPPHGLDSGTWVVAGDCTFADMVTEDLRGAGLEVEHISEGAAVTDLDDVVGFVAASSNDLTNLAIAEHVLAANSDVYLCVRQRTNTYRALLHAMQIDSVYISTELVAREVLARVLSPVFWQYIELLLQQEDAFAEQVRDELVERCGRRAPERDVITLDEEHAPAVVHWLDGHGLQLGDLLRHPNDRDSHLPLVVLMVERDGQQLLAPASDTALQTGDRVLLAGTGRGLADIRDSLFYPATLEYIVTGEQVPTTWVWRALRRRRAA